MDPHCPGVPSALARLPPRRFAFWAVARLPWRRASGVLPSKLSSLAAQESVWLRRWGRWGWSSANRGSSPQADLPPQALRQPVGSGRPSGLLPLCSTHKLQAGCFVLGKPQPGPRGGVLQHKDTAPSEDTHDPAPSAPTARPRPRESSCCGGQDCSPVTPRPQPALLEHRLRTRCVGSGAVPAANRRGPRGEAPVRGPPDGKASVCRGLAVHETLVTGVPLAPAEADCDIPFHGRRLQGSVAPCRSSSHDVPSPPHGPPRVPGGALMQSSAAQEERRLAQHVSVHLS